MTTNRNYTNLTVNRAKVEKFREIYDEYELEQSFNTWILDLIESGLSRMDFMKNHLNKYSFAELEGNGFAIFDKRMNKIVRIHYEKNKLICSEHKAELCNHKIYATLHPKFLG